MAFKDAVQATLTGVDNNGLLDFTLPTYPSYAPGDMLVVFITFNDIIVGEGGGNLVVPANWNEWGAQLNPVSSYKAKAFYKIAIENEPLFLVRFLVAGPITIQMLSFTNVETVERVHHEKNEGTYASPHVASFTPATTYANTNFCWYVVEVPTTQATWSTSAITAGFTQRLLSTGASQKTCTAVYTKDNITAAESGALSVTFTGSSNSLGYAAFGFQLRPKITAPAVTFGEIRTGLVEAGDQDFGPVYRGSVQTLELEVMVGSNSVLYDIGNSNNATEDRNTVYSSTWFFSPFVKLLDTDIKAANSRYMWGAIAAKFQAFNNYEPWEIDTIYAGGPQCHASMAYIRIDIPLSKQIAYYLENDEYGVPNMTYVKGGKSYKIAIDSNVNDPNGVLRVGFVSGVSEAASSHADVGGIVTPPVLPAMTLSGVDESTLATRPGIELIFLGWSDASADTNVGMSLPAGFTTVGAIEQSTASNKIAFAVGYRLSGFSNDPLTFGLSSVGGASNPGWVAGRILILFNDAVVGRKFKKR